MASDQDKESAGIPFNGEAKRLTIRRPRLDRDGLYLFGRRWSAQSVVLTPREFQALSAGKTIAVDIRGEYLVYLLLDQGKKGS